MGATAGTETLPLSPGCSTTWINGLADIASNYDAFLVDLWGVIHDGKAAFPWALEALKELRAQGKPVVFLSNSSRRREFNAAALARMGVEEGLYADMITSGEETWKALDAALRRAEAASSAPGGSLLRPELLKGCAEGRVYTFGNGSDDNEYLQSLGLPAEGAALERASLLLARGCSTAGQRAGASMEELDAVLAEAAKLQIPMLVANPDLVRPDGNESPMPGLLARKYVAMGGPAPQCVGKPHRQVFEAALQSLEAAGVSAGGGARLCMIGDSVWHDVRGARDFGLDVVLLATGIHSKALGVEQAPAAPRRPSSERLAGFLGALPSCEAPTYMAPSFCWRPAGTSDSQAAAPGATDQKRPVVVTCGAACVDIIQTVSTYPAADAKVRSVAPPDWLGGGNAANTACALARLGTPAALLTKIGDDPLGEVILNTLRADGADVSGVMRAKGMNSPYSTVLVDQAAATRTIVHSAMPEDFQAEEIEPYLDEGSVLTPEVRWVHLDGRHPAAALKLAQAATQRGIGLSIDCERPREGLEALLPLCDVIFCNASFASTWTGLEGLPAALSGLLNSNDRAKIAITTRGARGSLMLADGSVAARLGKGAPALPVTCCHGSFEAYHTIACDAWPLPAGKEVVDTTGAGDVFIAGFLHAWVQGRPASVALATGAFTATSKIQRVGGHLAPDFNGKDLPEALVAPCEVAA